MCMTEATDDPDGGLLYRYRCGTVVAPWRSTRDQMEQDGRLHIRHRHFKRERLDCQAQRDLDEREGP